MPAPPLLAVRPPPPEWEIAVAHAQPNMRLRPRCHANLGGIERGLQAVELQDKGYVRPRLAAAGGERCRQESLWRCFVKDPVSVVGERAEDIVVGLFSEWGGL